jgi:hypothetical protein
MFWLSGCGCKDGGGRRYFILGEQWIAGDGLGQTKAWFWLWSHRQRKAGSLGHGADGV